jgi:propionyl-CoA carboxylase beta chain
MSRRSKEIIELFTQSNKETTAKLPYELNDEVEQLATIIPDNPNKPYDMHGVIAGIIDEDSFMKLHKIMLKILL